jgi:hypothetical protein
MRRFCSLLIADLGPVEELLVDGGEDCLGPPERIASPGEPLLGRPDILAVELAGDRVIDEVVQAIDQSSELVADLRELVVLGHRYASAVVPARSGAGRSERPMR